MVTQAIVQDIIWIYKAAQEISKVPFSAYFIPIDPIAAADTKKFYVIMPLTQKFIDRYQSAWRRLTKSDDFDLILYDRNNEDKGPGTKKDKEIK